MPKMNYWAREWKLREDICPCDVHFNQWIADRDLRDKTIYHFGTGSHHVVGREQASNGSNNAVFAITASKEEYQTYIDLVTNDSRIGSRYVVYFGDIYLTNPRLLPEFDVVTMFHLREYFHPSTSSEAYGGFTDRGALDVFTARIRSEGHILFYTGSVGFELATPIIAEWEQANPVERVGEFKTLLIYRKK
ncbi:hypothetical protein [Nannocystis radixulma]|uniref:Uncharacterized protein n=1 Tax=Nannocystis radixulma TaxID=2995305 RepID=A0ABT5B6V8_9BACT|nr:hypothetical protein [Nannocystis radixulma]MDC0669468.1 hypothetical protein [Nannocystis radixulma]